jgi:hypothetical protein
MWRRSNGLRRIPKGRGAGILAEVPARQAMLPPSRRLPLTDRGPSIGILGDGRPEALRNRIRSQVARR